MHRGYVKLWRKSIDGGWLSNPNLWAFWCYCLLRANHRPCKVILGFTEIELEPGQFVFGRKQASKDIGLSEQTVRTCLQTLKSTSNITIKSTNKFSIITIINWNSYQDDEIKATSKSTSKSTNGQPTTNQQLTTDKNVKNEKNEKKRDMVARRRQIPVDFILSEKLLQFAKEHGINGNRIHDVFEHFKEHHQSRGTVMLDWDKAFMTWVRNDKKFGVESKKAPTFFDEEQT
jgi:hypothetical protein